MYVNLHSIHTLLVQNTNKVR